LDFFGATRSLLRGIRAKDGALVATSERLRDDLTWTSGGLDHIPGDFDAYVVVGGGISFALMLATLRTHCPVHLCETADVGNAQLISDALFLEGLRDMVERSAANRVITELRSITKAPIAMAPCPYVTKAVLSHPRYAYWRSERARQCVFTSYHQLLDDFQTRCTIALQPEETVEERMFTRDEYARGSVKLKKGLPAHDDDDYHHMNANFGALCLSNIFSEM
jgi:hypothetical protein